MNSFMQKKTTWNRICEYILKGIDYAVVFLTIISIGSAWVYDPNLSISYTEIYAALLKMMVLYVILSIALKKNLSSDFNLKMMVFVVVSLITYSIVSAYNREEFILRFLLIVIWMILWIILHEDKADLWRIYVNVGVIIALISLFYYVFVSIFGVIPETYSFDRTFGKWRPEQVKNYQYLFYQSHILTVKGKDIWRNCAFFMEAPKSTFAFCSAFAAEAFLNTKRNKWKIIILAIAAVTTFSTRAFMFLLLSGVFFLYLNLADFPIIMRGFAKIRKYIKYIWILVLIGSGVIVLSKMLDPSSASSMGTHVDHSIACFKAFAKCTMYGCGYHNDAYILQFTEIKQGIAAGIPYYLAWGGVLMGAIIAIPFLHDIIEGVKRKNYNRLLFECMIMFLFCFGMPEAIVQLLIAWMVTDTTTGYYE